MHDPGTLAAAVPLPDGRVLLVGDGAASPSSLELLDPKAERFSGYLALPFIAESAICLRDGRVLFPGFPSHIYWP